LAAGGKPVVVRDATQHMQAIDCGTLIAVEIVIRVLVVKVFTALRALGAGINFLRQIPNLVRVEVIVVLSQGPCITLRLCQ
jgi:hypothetical protein